MSGFRQTRWIGLVLLLAACAQEPQRARYTVEEYRADAELRQAQLARCRDDPGTLAKSPDCVNAERAALVEDRARLRELPAVGLDRRPDSP